MESAPGITCLLSIARMIDPLCMPIFSPWLLNFLASRLLTESLYEGEYSVREPSSKTVVPSELTWFRRLLIYWGAPGIGPDCENTAWKTIKTSNDRKND